MAKRQPSNKKRSETFDFESLSLSQQILLMTDGTVTDILSLLTGEPIHVTKLSQSIITDDLPAVLEIGEEDTNSAKPIEVLQRDILLTGVRDNYIYAQSLFVVSRMSPSMQKNLLETDTPIGLLWKQEKLETYRDIISQGLTAAPELREHFPFTDSDDFLYRTYTVRHNQKPIGVITEKFPLGYFD